MAQENQTNKELSIDQRINAEVRKIKPLFKNLDKDKKRFIDKQIYQLAFLQVTLDRLTEAVNTTAILEDFKQGSQEFKRDNTALRQYNATIKGYISLSKQLCELLPNTEIQKAGQALMSFVAAPKKIK